MATIEEAALAAYPEDIEASYLEQSYARKLRAGFIQGAQWAEQRENTKRSIVQALRMLSDQRVGTPEMAELIAELQVVAQDPRTDEPVREVILDIARLVTKHKKTQES